MASYCYFIVPRISIEVWIASTVDERTFWVEMCRLTSNHTGTIQCAMGYDTIYHGLWECGIHCTLRNELQEKLWAARIDHVI
jgi:hypothetical protein